MSENQASAASIYARSALVGIVTGMRSTLPFALQSWLKENDEQQIHIPLLPQVHINVATLRTITSLLSLSELFGDKTARIPSRISPIPLVGRLTLGTLSGMLLARRAQQSPLLGAILGGVGAGVGSYAGYYSRSALKRITHLPDPLLGIAEDALALGLGTLALKGIPEQES